MKIKSKGLPFYFFINIMGAPVKNSQSLCQKKTTKKLAPYFFDALINPDCISLNNV
jgi:hypothetical protein